MDGPLSDSVGHLSFASNSKLVTQGRWVELVISFQIFDLLLIGPNPQGLELSCQVNGNISTRVPCHRERENSISIQNNTRNFNNPFSLQPLENCEEAIHGEWKTNRHRGKIFRAFAGLKANMTQIKSEILLYKIKEAYFWQPLAESASKIYPGWRMRIYHNITEEDHMVLKSQFLFPKLFFFNLLICLLNFVVHSMQSTQCFSPKKK